MNKSDELIKKFQDIIQNDEFWEEIEKRGTHPKNYQ